MPSLLFTFGTRPEAIKLVPLILEGVRRGAFDVRICVTAQHRSMLDQVLDLFAIRPDIDLEIMRENQSLADLTSAIVSRMDEVMRNLRPDCVVVQGDTTTTFTAALSAFYAKVPVAHVEAGLRSGDVHSPWPEEMNRRLTTHLASWHFAPTLRNRDNLRAEGIDDDRVWVTGNTGIDTLLHVNRQLAFDSQLVEHARGSLMRSGLEFFQSDGSRRIALITGHRRESFGQGLQNLCEAIRTLAESHPDTEFIYPVHLNPNVRKPVADILRTAALGNVHLLEPLEYLPFVALMSLASLIITDSGGIQEEAPSLRKPVLVTRDTTERPEGIEAGLVKLVGTDRRRIVAEAEAVLSGSGEGWNFEVPNPYGDGLASQRIMDVFETLMRGARA